MSYKPYNDGLYFYPRSPCGERLYLVRGQRPSWGISIHALLAESDPHSRRSRKQRHPFLSTLSLRRATNSANTNLPSHRNFYPRSPCGERLKLLLQLMRVPSFLSTLSLRRATPCMEITSSYQVISIHALLAESD